VQDGTSLLCLILTILEELFERMQPFQQAEIAETLYSLLRKGSATLRIQVLYTAMFLCKHPYGSLEKYFEKTIDLTDEDVKALLSSVGCQHSVAKTLKLIKSLLFSTSNCSTLTENGTPEFLRKSLEEESNSDLKHQIISLIERLMEHSKTR
jgi:hypothetical protein